MDFHKAISIDNSESDKLLETFIFLTGWPLSWKAGRVMENEKGFKWSGKSQNLRRKGKVREKSGNSDSLS